MFERFTERARHAVELGRTEARAFRHPYLGTEHILLGLLGEEAGIASRALESLGVTAEEVRVRVGRIVGQGDEIPDGGIPFTPRVKKVFELALREALALGHNYIGTEHLLLGIVRENEGVAARILLELGADADRVRSQIIGILSGPGRRARGPGGVPAGDRRLLSDVRMAPPRWYYLPAVMLVAGWVLFALALGAGILVGWAISG